MQKILGSHWKSSPKDWLLSLCLRPAADHGPYVAWQTQLISEHADRTETLSHAPVKAWPANTPGGILICYNLLVLVSKSFKRGGGDGGWRERRMNSAGVHPSARCHAQRALTGWAVPASLSRGVPNPASGPGPHGTSQPGPNSVPREVPDALGPGGPRLLPSCPGPCWGDGTRYSWQDPALPTPWSPDTICIQETLGLTSQAASLPPPPHPRPKNTIARLDHD